MNYQAIDILRDVIEKKSATNNDPCINEDQNGNKPFRHTTKKDVICSLLGIQAAIPQKITVTTTYPVYPPLSGGQNRIFFLYRELAKKYRFDIITLAAEHEKGFRKEIAPGLWEIRVPKSKQYAQKEMEMHKKAGVPVTDIAMLFYYHETKEYIEAVKKSIREASLAIVSHPYTYPLVKSLSDIPIIYDSHNVEYILKKQMMPENPSTDKYLEHLFETEKQLCLECLATTVCTVDDADTMNHLYGLDRKKTLEVANGVDLDSIKFVNKKERETIKKTIGLDTHQKTILFIGSWHQPNLDAIEEIFKMAEKLEEYIFLIVGSASLFYDKAPDTRPGNMAFMGLVDNEKKNLLLSIADIAINPMLSGSGTNMKMLDYMASGLPVISTPVGARGLNLPAGSVVVCEIDDFIYHIRNIDKNINTKKNSKFVRRRFNWKKISKKMEKILSLS